jgi:hypothetical protein
MPRLCPASNLGVRRVGKIYNSSFLFLGYGSMFHCGTLFLTAWATPAQLHLAAADYSGYLLVSDCSATSAPKLQERQQ